jgi:hypothetical protein
LDERKAVMKKLSWILVVVGALLGLTIGFVAGAYVGFRHTLLYSVRRDVGLFGPDHDEFVHLGKYGAKEDIPSLLYGLKQQTDKEECTYQHCLEALRNLSGASPGETYSDWTNWWVREMKEPVPDWHPTYGLVPWKKFIQQDGGPNRGQPARPETNRTSSAAGSGR